MVKNDHRAALRVVEGGNSAALGSSGPNQRVLELARAQQAELLSADDKAMLKSTATAEQAALIDRAQTMSEVMQALGLDPGVDTVDVEGIKNRLDLPLEQIKKLARQRPDTVAMLLKTWISEDR
jgi:flagellar biosynthesis/type III secretory pathway M-ring protein FliF/YscJ